MKVAGWTEIPISILIMTEFHRGLKTNVTEREHLYCLGDGQLSRQQVVANLCNFLPFNIMMKTMLKVLYCWNEIYNMCIELQPHCYLKGNEPDITNIQINQDYSFTSHASSS